jgi:CheY-like chemotaxis protein
MNAVSNAVKFTPIGGGGVIMSARLLRDSSPSSVEIQVTDSGRGLLGKTLHELATEVSGSIPLRPTAVRSSGFGIPICILLAELMGGSIELVDREDGPGARFTLTLPTRYVAGPVRARRPSDARVLPYAAITPIILAGPLRVSDAADGGAAAGGGTAMPVVRAVSPPRPPSAHAVVLGPVRRSVARSREHDAAAAASADATASLSEFLPARDFRGTRILAVDDSPANLRFAVFMLKKLGCVAQTCTDGDQVVDAMEAAAASGAPIDVVVMDMHMERMNGDAALAALRASGLHVPVVVSTANATTADAARYRELGFCALLSKPYAHEDMRVALAAALRAN